MKNQVAASAVAIASLAREGFMPPGDLVFVAAADEEVGENYGLQWLCEHHPDAVRVDYAINEGGGERVELGGRAFYLCAAAEKMSSPFRVTVHGRSGHASMPGIADNALVKAAPLIEKLAAYRPEPSIGPEVAGFLDAVLGEQPAPGDVLERLAAVDQLAVDTIEPLLSFTLSPTMIEASERRNVIPGTVELTVDRRLLPGQLPEDVDPIVRSILGDGGHVELETIERFGGTRSPLDTPLWNADLRLGRGDRAGREAGAALLLRLHRLALAARGVRHRRVRLLPDADDEPGAGGAADPLRRRADARRRPRPRRRVPPRGRPLAELAVLELHSPEGAFEQIEAYLRERGFFAPGGEALEADLYLGYGLSEPLRRTNVASPPEPCPLPLAAVSVRDMSQGLSLGHVRDRPVGAVVGRCGLRRSGRGGARGDRARRRLPGQPRPAPERRRSRATPAALAERLASFAPRLLAGDGWAVVSASPELFLARRGRRVWTAPIKGTRPLGEHVEGREGRGRARDDRRPRAQRPLPRLRARVGALAGADGRARARRRHAPRLDGRGHAPRRRRPRRAAPATFPGGSVTGAPKIAALDLIAALEPVGRGASMGALGVVRGNGDLDLSLTIRTFAVAEGRIHLWVGGGIVWDSEPEAEIEESWTKARPLLAAIGAPVEVAARR